MAHVMLLPKGMASMSHVYLTDHPVGAGQMNKRDDVLLVQFFLAALSADPLRKGSIQFNYQTKEGKYLDYTVPGQSPMKIDGVCGSQTVAYIKHFQAEGSKGVAAGSYLSLVKDGVVTPSKAGIPWSRNDRLLSIIKLNVEYSNMYGAIRLANLGSEPLFPKELMRSFYMTY